MKIIVKVEFGESSLKTKVVLVVAMPLLFCCCFFVAALCFLRVKKEFRERERERVVVVFVSFDF